MKATRWFAPAGLAVVVVVAGGFLLFKGAISPPAPVRPVVGSAPEQNSRAELSGVEGQLNALRAEVQALKAAAEPARPSTVESAAPPPAPPPPSPSTPEELRARLDLAFDNEGVDIAWARAEERAITDFVNKEAPSGKLKSLECRSSLCRMTLEFESESALGTFRSKLGAPPLDNGGFYQIEDTRFTYISPRKGHELPLEDMQ